MNKSCLACMATFLLGASVAWGQGQEAQPVPMPVKVPEPPAAWHLCDGLKSCFCAETGGAGIFTAEAEYVLWFLANSHDSAALASTDFLGRGSARVTALLGDAEQENREPVSGARCSFGYWLTEDNDWITGGIRDVGAEITLLFVTQRSASAMDSTSPTLVRPFFDLNNRQESGFVVAAPGLATGGVAARAQAEIWGAEANVWKNVYYDHPATSTSVSLMAGIRYLDLDARLNIGSISAFNQNVSAFPPFAPFAGNTLQVSDSFATHNRFYGGQIGISGKWWPGESAIFVELGAKLGLGTTSEDLQIAGGQVRTLANGTQVFTPAGLLALASNSGSKHVNKFSQVPELNLKVAAPLMDHVTLSTGFSLLYWSRLLRPALQIDRSLDITQIPNFPPGALAAPTGLGQPSVPFRQSDLLLLGVSFGLEIHW